MYYLYLLQNADDPDDFYIGHTGDLKRRYVEHNAGKVHATRGRRWKLIYYEAYHVLDAARDRERIMKHDGRTRRALMERIKRFLE